MGILIEATATALAAGFLDQPEVLHEVLALLAGADAIDRAYLLHWFGNGEGFSERAAGDPIAALLRRLADAIDPPATERAAS